MNGKAKFQFEWKTGPSWDRGKKLVTFLVSWNKRKLESKKVIPNQMLIYWQ